MNVNKVFRYLSIRSKLLVVFVVLAAAPLSLLGWYGIRSMPQALTERALAQLEFEVATKADVVGHFLMDVQQDVLYLAGSSSLRALVTGSRQDDASYSQARQQLAEQFVHFSQGKRGYYQLRYLNEKGREVVRLNYNGKASVIVPEDQLQDKSDRYYFQEAMQVAPGKIYVSRMDLNVEFGRVESPAQPVVRYATPVQGPAGDKKGIVIINLFATHLFALIQKLPPQSESFLINRNGNYLYWSTAGKEEFFDPTRRQHISQIYPPEILSELVMRKSAAALLPEGGILAHAPVPLLDSQPELYWILGTGIPGDTVLYPIKRMEAFFLVVFSLMIVFAVVVGVLSARHFSRSILALRDGAAIIADGNFDYRIQIETNDEIEDLGKQFNVMAERLGESVHRMERWNEELHEEVARQTQELRSSEERLRIENRKLDDIITGIGAEIFLVDSSLNIIWANKSCLEHHGGQDRILGNPCFQVCRAREAPCEPCAALQTFQDGKVQSIVREVRQGDQEKFYQVMTTPVVDQSGHVFQVLELRLDITGSVQRERAIRQQTAENEKLEALVQLSAGVIHEVANPLAAIRTTIDVMEKELPADRLQHFGAVRRKIEDLAGFLHSFSLYAKPGRPDLYASDIRHVLRSVAQLLQDEAAKRRVVIVERYDENLPLVEANPPQLQQVFINLLLNALDAMPEGGEVVLSAQGQPDGTLAVAVADAGIGIAAEQLKRIFEPFFSTKPSGTGLGLAIVQQIIKAHGAQLNVDSMPGHGTRFTIDFPLATAAERAKQWA